MAAISVPTASPTQHEERRGLQASVEDQPDDRASHDGDHHDRGHLAKDLDEPQ